MNRNFIYKVVTIVDGKLKSVFFDSVEDLTEQYEQIGVTNSPHVREELQGQPRLDELYGAMYDGIHEGKVCIRYESREVYDLLSQ